MKITKKIKLIGLASTISVSSLALISCGGSSGSGGGSNVTTIAEIEELLEDATPEEVEEILEEVEEIEEINLDHLFTDLNLVNNGFPVNIEPGSVFTSQAEDYDIEFTVTSASATPTTVFVSSEDDNGFTVTNPRTVDRVNGTGDLLINGESVPGLTYTFIRGELIIEGTSATTAEITSEIQSLITSGAASEAFDTHITETLNPLLNEETNVVSTDLTLTDLISAINDSTEEFHILPPVFCGCIGITQRPALLRDIVITTNSQDIYGDDITLNSSSVTIDDSQNPANAGPVGGPEDSVPSVSDRTPHAVDDSARTTFQM